MSYDRIWLECDEYPGVWHERREFEESGRSGEFEIDFARLFAQGHYVVLVAGRNYCFDELFLFRNASTAGRFYDDWFSQYESFLNGDDVGCGFQEVSLHIDGQLVSTKSLEASMGDEVNRG